MDVVHERGRGRKDIVVLFCFVLLSLQVGKLKFERLCELVGVT